MRPATPQHPKALASPPVIARSLRRSNPLLSAPRPIIRIALTLLLLTLATTLPGCLSAAKIAPERFYTIDPQLKITAQPKSLPLSLGIRPLMVARPYKLPLAYEDQNQQLGFRIGESWAEPPGAVVTRAITDALRATRLFSDTGNAAEMARPDLILTGELRKFHENRATTPHTAEVEVHLELRESRTAKNYWSDTLTASVPLQGDTGSELAAAMNKAVEQIAFQAVEGVSISNFPGF